MFENYSTNEIKNWLTENKVLIVTNSRCIPGTTFVASLKSYLSYVPIHNFTIIRGSGEDNIPFYGVNVFLTILQKIYKDVVFKNFDYMIYIDDDCFITDFKSLLEEFNKFIKDDSYCLAGTQDGGVICHRNHASYMINTFLSFWNLKLLRKKSSNRELVNVIQTLQPNLTDSSQTYMHFLNKIKSEKPTLFETIKNNAQRSIEEISDYRQKHFKNDEVPYCNIVRNDPNNSIEPHQIPYSFTDDIEQKNFEPYYLIEQSVVLLTEKPIMYFFATDYYDENKSDDETDNSGLSSAVYTSDSSHKLIAVHTWFSRAYLRWPLTEIQLNHTRRILKVINELNLQ